MPDADTCLKCYWFKLRWKDGSGVCWKHQEHRDDTDPTCEHFEPRVIWVNKGEHDNESTDVER